VERARWMRQGKEEERVQGGYGGKVGDDGRGAARDVIFSSLQQIHGDLAPPTAICYRRRKDFLAEAEEHRREPF
jgi:hypothetical protein